ncbi:MAG: hypothetical protein ACOCWL_00905 [Thermoguttaceae bacterium]
MSDSQRFSGPQFRADEAEEHEAVRTTIVGGRPPGSGQPVGPIPRGVEVLIKKASVDAGFRSLLLERRAAAADEIGLRLDPAEALMLAAAPAAQLEAIIDRTTVPQEHRRAFLGKAATAMLAAVGLSAAGCPPVTLGVRPDGPPPAPAGVPPDMPPERPEQQAVPEGAAPHQQPERLEAVDGIRPDMPPE